MTILEKIKQLTDDGYAIEFSKRRRTIPPTTSMIITPENDLMGAYEFVFLPEQWNEESIIEGVDCLMKQIEEDKNSPKKRELCWSFKEE